MNPGTGWIDVGQLDEDDPPGSISNNITGGREIIRFRWEGEVAIIDRSLAGADTEEGPFRKIITVGFETLATLQPGGEYQMPVMTDQMTRPEQLRFRHVSR